MAKKKKSQLKPIPRGFATTSIAKKVIPLDEEPETPHHDGNVDDERPSRCKATNGNPVLVHEDEFDPEKAEEQSLQNLVDKLQDRTEKEVTRTIKVCIIVVIAGDQRVHAILTGNRSRQTLC
jgi:ATP-dependent RNA helicase DHX29